MKNRHIHFFSAAVLVLSLAHAPAQTSDQEGVAVAIVFDTSGSMKDAVRDGSGRMSPKYRIATRSLAAVAGQLESYATNSGGTVRTINAGLFIFAADGNGARAAVKFGPLDAAALRSWAERFQSPSGGTPLGAGLQAGAQAVLKSGLKRKHVLVITDGINTVGADPASVMPTLRKQADKAGTAVSVHFVAFDVNANVFAPVKKLGATVVGAADEKQLQTQLDFILQRKILLEDEEPAKK